MTKKRADFEKEEAAAPWDPLEALTDIVTGDAFSFFDPPEVETVTKEVTDAATNGGATSADESGGAGTGRKRKPTVVPAPEPTITTITKPVSGADSVAAKAGAPAGKQKPTEGGEPDGGSKEGTPEPTVTK